MSINRFIKNTKEPFMLHLKYLIIDSENRSKKLSQSSVLYKKTSTAVGFTAVSMHPQVLSSKCNGVATDMHTVKNMPEYGFSLTCIFPHKDRIGIYGKIRVNENLNSGIFYPVTLKFWRSI